MQKRVVFVIIGGLLTIGFLTACGAASQGEPPQYLSPQDAAVKELLAASSTQPVFHFRGDFPRGISARVKVDGADPVERARNFIDTYRALYLLDDIELDLVPNRVVDIQGQEVIFSQTYRSLPVFASQIAVTLTGDMVTGTTGSLLHGDITLETIPALSPTEALNSARQFLGLPEAKPARQPELMIFDMALITDAPSDPRLVYVVDLASGGLLRAFVDAHSGELVNSYSLSEGVFDVEVRDGVGLDFGGCPENAVFSYVAADENGIAVEESRSEAALEDVTRAALGSQTVYDFYAEQLDRDSYNDKGGKVNMLVQVKLVDTIAGFYGSCIAFISGAVQLDVIGHEFTHWVINDVNSSQLVYEYESGALNESLADIMGAMIDGNWTVAEDSGAFRSLEDPTIYGHPDQYSDYQIIDDDNHGVHTNSGIMNKAAFLITEGGTFNGMTIQGIGWQPASTIFYNTLLSLPSDADMHVAAFHMVNLVAVLTPNEQILCTVHNSLYAVQLLPFPDLDCDGIEDWADDADADSFPLNMDNCPNDHNPSQLDVDDDGLGNLCDTDDDGDQVADNADNCPVLANPSQGDADKDGLGNQCDPQTPPDEDNDGIPNSWDNCPSNPNPDQKNSDSGSFGDACDDDADNDWNPNGVDNCWLVPNNDQGDIDDDGKGDACDAKDNNHYNFEVLTYPGGLTSLPVPICDTDQAGWYSSDFTVGLLLQGMGDGVTAWVSGANLPYLTAPSIGEQQTHFFSPHVGENYFLNFSFANDIPSGEPRTISLQYACGLFSQLNLALVSEPTSTPAPDLAELPLPFATFLKNGNCRLGPGSAYESLDVRLVGYQAAIDGRTPDDAWLRIFLPTWGQSCWVSSPVVEITGELITVKVYEYPSQPTFTPEGSTSTPAAAVPTKTPTGKP
jgi:Zn-dependent metalloprotease